MSCSVSKLHCHSCCHCPWQSAADSVPGSIGLSLSQHREDEATWDSSQQSRASWKNWQAVFLFLLVRTNIRGVSTWSEEPADYFCLALLSCARCEHSEQLKLRGKVGSWAHS